MRQIHLLLIGFVCGMPNGFAQTPDNSGQGFLDRATLSDRSASPAVAEQVADEQLLKSAGLPTDGPRLLEFFRKRTLTHFVFQRDPKTGKRTVEARGAEQERLSALIRRMRDTDFAKREKASAELIAVGGPALPPLLKAMADADPEVQRRAEKCSHAIERINGTVLPAAVRVLKARKPDGACAVLLGFLPFAGDEPLEEEIIVALQGLAVRDGKADAGLVAGLRSNDVERRAAAAVVVGQLGDGDQRSLVRKLLTDADAKVRLRAAQGLIAGRDLSAVPTLLALLADGPIDLARQAEESLGRLAGDRAPVVALDETEAMRRRSRDAWTTWWRSNGERLEVSRAGGDILSFNTTRRARDAAQRFIAAYIKGDTESLIRQSELPFHDFSNGIILRTPERLRRMFDNVGGVPEGQPMPTFTLRRIAGVNEYAREVFNANRDQKTVLSRLRKPDVRVVYVRVEDDGVAMNGVLFVRVNGTQARVIGTGPDASD
ncbi:MAG: HEAT repeat domain-containing protein [Gemmataceae bacterium]|nr:HEAT repeat domain-containing protein [Gemmataceae bacterium]